ncbi:hypothetical protein BKA81DRAFT_353396 [Phyllosticta paracitricarpa]
MLLARPVRVGLQVTSCWLLLRLLCADPPCMALPVRATLDSFLHAGPSDGGGIVFPPCPTRHDWPGRNSHVGHDC